VVLVAVNMLENNFIKHKYIGTPLPLKVEFHGEIINLTLAFLNHQLQITLDQQFLHII
jgi:hypothetical protein